MLVQSDISGGEEELRVKFARENEFLINYGTHRMHIVNQMQLVNVSYQNIFYLFYNKLGFQQ